MGTKSPALTQTFTHDLCKNMMQRMGKIYTFAAEIKKQKHKQ